MALSALGRWSPGAMAALVAAAALACGQSSAPALEPVPGDGAGAFGPAAPVEICHGSARIVPPADGASAAALCVPDAVAPRSCSADADCEGIERCMCGRCIVRPCADAAACDAEEVCRAQRCTTSCATDADCGPDARCVAGGCARVCQSDAACHAGELCDALDGACRGVPCSEAVACASGDRCEAAEVVGDVREPEVIEHAGGTLAFFELRDAAGGQETAAIFRARVSGATRWIVDPLEPVLAGDDGEGVGAPSVLASGQGLELFYEVAGGERIERATSSDGASFLRQGVVLEPAEAWEAGRVASPSAFGHAGARWLVYEGGARAGIGLARLDGGAATRIGSDALITAASLEDARTWRAVSEVGTPYAVVDGEGDAAILRIYLTARGIEGLDAHGPGGVLPAEPNDSIGMFASRDGERFERAPAGPVLARVQNLRAHPGEREPCVRFGAHGPTIVFSGSDATGTRKSGLARAGP
jgi:hypothetical protein